MAKQRYRLQALLTIKGMAKKRAEIALGKALAALKEARDRIEKLKAEKRKIVERWKQARADMKARMGHGAAVGEGNVHVNFLRKLKEDEEAKEREIEDQKEVVAECEEQVAIARRAYIDACKELQIMEKHKDLWEKKVRDELTRKEEREMDELGGTIHQLRRWRGEKSIFEVK
jgi:flagellar export protein FliJ